MLQKAALVVYSEKSRKKTFVSISLTPNNVTAFLIRSVCFLVGLKNNAKHVQFSTKARASIAFGT